MHKAHVEGVGSLYRSICSSGDYSSAWLLEEVYAQIRGNQHCRAANKAERKRLARERGGVNDT